MKVAGHSGQGQHPADVGRSQQTDLDLPEIFSLSVFPNSYKMPKESIKDKLDGNELDLSLGDLSTVPVKDLVSVSCIVAHRQNAGHRLLNLSPILKLFFQFWMPKSL